MQFFLLSSSIFMMNMMYTTGPDFEILWALHVLSVIAFAIGIVFLLFWSHKKLSEHDLWKWGWMLVIIGTIVCLFTIGAMGHTWNNPRMGGFAGGGMMGQRGFVEQGTKSAAQIQEEADGKALYDKLQAKQTTCAKLSDNDFELIGEYAMGQQAGLSHEQMNAMIKDMMGDESEAQIHILIGKNYAGCSTGTQATGGMMGGAMMRASSSAR